MDELLKNDHSFQVFQERVKFFRYDGQKKGTNGKNGLALISFPQATSPNGCLCPPEKCEDCDANCSNATYLRFYNNEHIRCPCWIKYDIDDLNDFIGKFSCV